MRMMRLLPGAKIAAHTSSRMRKFLYLTDGAITYGGKTWKGGKTETEERTFTFRRARK